jgi:hypothetical protein
MSPPRLPRWQQTARRSKGADPLYNIIPFPCMHALLEGRKGRREQAIPIREMLCYIYISDGFGATPSTAPRAQGPADRACVELAANSSLRGPVPGRIRGPRLLQIWHESSHGQFNKKAEMQRALRVALSAGNGFAVLNSMGYGPPERSQQVWGRRCEPRSSTAHVHRAYALRSCAGRK